MKNYVFQIILGILLAVSAYSLSQAAGIIDRVETRVDRIDKRIDQVDIKLDGHCENFNIHNTEG